MAACHNGKCLDCYVMLIYCSLCALNKKELSTEEFNIYIKRHECNSNHNNSSSSMKLLGQLKSSTGLSLNTILSSEKL